MTRTTSFIAGIALLLALDAHAQTRANGLTINVPVIGRVTGANNTVFRSSVTVSNNIQSPTQVDFYFDAVDQRTQQPIVIDGTITNDGLRGQAGGLLRAYSTAHIEDFVDALTQAGMLPVAARDNGVLGSVMFVFNGFNQRGQGAASARFYNSLGNGTVGVALTGHYVTAEEPRGLVASVRDTRGRPGPQLSTNMFINNIGLVPNGSGTAGTIDVELSARSNSNGQPIGTPITLRSIGPGQTQNVNSVLQALQVPASAGDTVLVFARVVSGNAAIAGVISIVDDGTRDGAIVDMARTN